MDGKGYKKDGWLRGSTGEGWYREEQWMGGKGYNKGWVVKGRTRNGW